MGSIGAKICKALKISGPFNIQFISKTYNVNFIELATKITLGIPVKEAVIQPIDMDHVTCKVPCFSFGRLKNSDPRLGVEMQSTGEVACFGVNQYEAFLKAMIAAGFKLPTKNVLICIGPQTQKTEFVNYARLFIDMGFQLYATKGTYELLKGHDGFQSVVMVYKPLVKREPNSLTLLRSSKIDLVINVPDSMDSQALTDGFELRRAAVDSAVPLITD